MADIQKYLGTASEYPITVSNGRIAIASGKRVIENAIIMILMTPVGTRYMLPEYGSRINELMYEQVDEVLASLLRTYILEALERWEKRCKFTSVEVIVGVDAAACKINYKILGSNEIDSFIWPYYKSKPLYV